MLSPLRARFANELDDFVAYMASEQGLSPISIRSHRWKTSKFLEWFANRHRLLSSATLDDVDEFLAFKAQKAQALLPSARGQSCFWSPFMDCEVVRCAGFSSTTSTGGQKRSSSRTPSSGRA